MVLQWCYKLGVTIKESFSFSSLFANSKEMQQHLRLLITEKIQSVAKNLEAQKEAWLKKNVSQPTQLICIFNLFHLSYSFGVHECSAALAHLN